MTNEQEFDRVVRKMCRESGDQLGYRPSRFLQMVDRYGAVTTTRKLLRRQQTSDGLKRLVRAGRSDLTIEALVLQPRFARLFTAMERVYAQQNLDAARNQ